MVYRKKYAKGGSAPLSKRQVKAVSKIANKQIHKMSELKILDEEPANLTATATQQLLKITPPAVGTGVDQRVGGNIYLRGYKLRGIVDCNTATATSLRVIVFQWLEPDAAAAPLTTELVESVRFMTFYKKNPQKHFKIINDQVFHWDSNVVQAPKTWTCDIPSSALGRRKPEYDGATTGNGNIYVYYHSDNGAEIRSLVFRTRFYDN